MEIDDSWRRIAGIHVTEAGDLGVVWLAFDRKADVLHMYDCAIFRHQPPAVIAEGINARGRWIPLAWITKAKPTAEMLKDRGANLCDELKMDDALAEVISNDIDERYRTRRLRIANRLSEFISEYKTFFRSETKVPVDSHPLMAATRYALAQLSWARPLRRKSDARRVNHARMAIV